METNRTIPLCGIQKEPKAMRKEILSRDVYGVSGIAAKR